MVEKFIPAIPVLSTIIDYYELVFIVVVVKSLSSNARLVLAKRPPVDPSGTVKIEYGVVEQVRRVLTRSTHEEFRSVLHCFSRHIFARR